MNLQYAPKYAKANRRHRQSLVVKPSPPPVVFGQFKHCSRSVVTYGYRQLIDHIFCVVRVSVYGRYAAFGDFVPSCSKYSNCVCVHVVNIG